MEVEILVLSEIKPGTERCSVWSHSCMESKIMVSHKLRMDEYGLWERLNVAGSNMCPFRVGESRFDTNDIGIRTKLKQATQFILGWVSLIDYPSLPWGGNPLASAELMWSLFVGSCHLSSDLAAFFQVPLADPGNIYWACTDYWSRPTVRRYLLHML